MGDTRESLALALRAAPRWEDTDTLARSYEEAYLRAALERFAIEADAIDAIFARAAAGDQYVIAALSFIYLEYAPNGAFHTAWLDRYRTLIGRTVRAGAELTADALGFDFSLENPRVRNIIRLRAAALVKNVTETTRDSIQAAVLTGRAQGLGMSQVAALIRETTFGEITKARALTIARTETVGALNAGEYAAATSSNVMRSKTWITQGDVRVRDSHAALNNLTIDIGAAFPNGLRYPHEPGAPAGEVINCRCSLLFSDEEAPL